MFKAFVFRLYPSASQRRRLEAVRETCRHFYNDLLRERKDAYTLQGVSITKTEQLRLVKARERSISFGSRGAPCCSRKCLSFKMVPASRLVVRT